jgi:hypothetical protein
MFVSKKLMFYRRNNEEEGTMAFVFFSDIFVAEKENIVGPDICHLFDLVDCFTNGDGGPTSRACSSSRTTRTTSGLDL